MPAHAVHHVLPEVPPSADFLEWAKMVAAFASPVISFLAGWFVATISARRAAENAAKTQRDQRAYERSLRQLRALGSIASHARIVQEAVNELANTTDTFMNIETKEGLYQQVLTDKIIPHVLASATDLRKLALNILIEVREVPFENEVNQAVSRFINVLFDKTERRNDNIEIVTDLLIGECRKASAKVNEKLPTAQLDPVT